MEMVACELHLWSSQCAKCYMIRRHRTKRHRRAPVRNALRGRTCHNTSVYVIPQMLQFMLHLRGVVLPRILKALMFSALVFGQSQFVPFKVSVENRTQCTSRCACNIAIHYPRISRSMVEPEKTVKRDADAHEKI